MSLLSIALQQSQLKPQYHPSYSTEPKGEAGRPVSKLRLQRKNNLLAISREIGESNLSGIMAIARDSDPKLHEDDARKMMDELVAERLVTRRVITKPRKKVFYTARSE